jgi:hypothetical protein
MTVGYFTKQSAHQQVWRNMDQTGDFQTTCHHLRYNESIIKEFKFMHVQSWQTDFDAGMLLPVERWARKPSIHAAC